VLFVLEGDILYCKLAIVGSEHRARVVLLPYEKRNSFMVEQWQACLQEGERLAVYDAPVALYLADWLSRNVEATLRKEAVTHTGDQLLRYKRMLVKQLSAFGAYPADRWTTYAYASDIPLQSSSMNTSLALEFSQHNIVNILQGRKLLYDEWLDLGSKQTNMEMDQLHIAFRYSVLHGLFKVRSSVQLTNHKGKLRCLRCYETDLVHNEHPCPYCGEYCYYCRTCLQMGRARTCSVIIMGQYRSPVEQGNLDCSPKSILNLETFGLSDAQQMATTKALNFVHQCVTDRYKRRHPYSTSGSKLARQFLLWAVTGAGKTEMIFPLVAYMTKLGGRVLLATPRRDVVLELSPRLRKAFPDLSIATLYGGSEERWQHGQLIIATTHQLMRFHQAFDLVIIDELDAFPYHGDERLYRVAEQCSTKKGVTLLLSATPPAYLQRELNKGRLAYVKLPVRYHRHPLPVPIRIKTPLITEQLNKNTIPPALIQALRSSLQEDAQVFIFLQRIIHTEAYASLLREKFPHVSIQATSSQDALRSEKVIAFRNRDIRILVTTTILERGVTVPRSHVYICDAEAQLFDEASLVQMAGRAGRSGDAPNGAVYFLSQQWNEAQRKAVKQIKSMNELANDLGYLLPQYRTKQQGGRRR